jgi:hypothetical protein
VPVAFLTELEARRWGRFGGEPTIEQLDRFFHLDADDLLVCNAVTLWNSRYTDRAIAVLVGRGRQVDPTDLERLSPLHHETINLHGRYTFNIPDAVRAGELRPLPLSADDA